MSVLGRTMAASHEETEYGADRSRAAATQGPLCTQWS